MMALQAEQVLLDEPWLRSKAALQQPGQKPEMVQSLTLQGTYSEKIAALGDAFKNFKNLRTLDLSKNVIVSLEGIEYLHSLQHLNLYYNNIPTVIEVARLHRLPYLKHLDLRLNPVARNEPDYRLAVVHILENLEKLDDRAVRESERKAAKIHFIMREEEELAKPKPEIKRERGTKSYMFNEKPSATFNSDTGAAAVDDSSAKWAFYTNPSNVSAVDPLTRLPSSTSSKQLQDRAGTEQPCQNELEDEYRPLPSPSRSSLRSPGKCVNSKSKEGFRVTFADNRPPENEFAVPPMESSNYESIFLTKRLCFSDTDPPLPSDPNEPKDHAYSYLTSTPLKKEALKSSEMDQRSSTFPDYSGRPPEDLKPASSQPSYGDLREHLDDSSDNKRSLNLSSDFYTTTHLKNEPLLSANHLSTLGKRFSDPLSKRPSSSADNLLEKSPLASVTTSRSSSPTRDKDSCGWRSLSPEKRPILTYETLDNLSADGELKRVPNLNSVLSSKPPKPPTMLRKAEPVSARGTINPSTAQRSQSDSEITSPINIILRQLLDLVDRYWNGSGSLHINQRFLSPARDLLSILMMSAPSQSSSTRRPDNQIFSEESKPASSKNDLEQFSYAQEEVDSMKKQLASVLEDNHTLQSQLRQLRAAAASNYSGSSTASLPNDELLWKNEQLTMQVELLTQQLQPYSKLQETVTLLQDSQRSLMSSNEYLLRQLNKSSSPQSVKLLHLTTDQKKTLDKYCTTESSDSSPLPSFYGSGQYRKVDCLSACPL